MARRLWPSLFLKSCLENDVGTTEMKELTPRSVYLWEKVQEKRLSRERCHPTA